MIEGMEDEMKSHSAIASAIAALDLAEKAGDTGPIDELEQKLSTLLTKHMEWNDGAAKAQLLEFFEAWGAKDPATIAGRRKLASLLFA